MMAPSVSPTESLVVDARYLTKAPKGLSAVESASDWMQYMTAYYPVVEFSKAAPGIDAAYDAIDHGVTA